MIRQLRLFLAAVQLLTRLPVPALPGFQTDWTARAVPYHPVVGWIVGAVSAAVYVLAGRLWSAPTPALLAVGAGLLLTGGLHEDGLADTADGLGGGRDPEGRLAIMKDSRVGAYGVMALLLVLGLRTAALSGLEPGRGALALIVVGGAARTLPALLMATLPYAGAPAQAKVPPASVRPGEAAAAALIGGAPLLLLGVGAGAVGLVVVTGVFLAARQLSHRLVGGWTGDLLGASEQIAEAALLLTAVAAA